MTVGVFDKRPCSLGEGPLWHPLRKQLFWFDINNKKMLSRIGDTPLEWQFDEHVSAAGWISENQLLIASETELFTFDIETQARHHIHPLEAENPITRSNDGRADPWGGFWIGTMGKHAEQDAGAIYRFFKGTLELLYSDITISNSICFSPDRRFAYYTDTPTKQIMRQALDHEGWPEGSSEVFIDLNEEDLNPDGSVVDAEGCLWNAQWGASRVARYSPEGQFLTAVSFPALQTSCPAFGGKDLQTLFVTTASESLTSPSTDQGRTYFQTLDIQGQSEHQVIL